MRHLLAALLGLIVLVDCGCRAKPPDTSTFPSPYTYPTEGLPPEKEDPR